MKTQTNLTLRIMLGAALMGLAGGLAKPAPANATDLLQRYPTTLTGGILQGNQARPWQFTPGDIYQISRFHLEVGGQLKVETGVANVGIGHCADGAVCAMLIPLEPGALTRQGVGSPEQIAHLWLRFHPSQINQLFPPDTVLGPATNNLITQMRAIAAGKLRSSYHAGINVLIPEPKDMTVDVDTKGGPRRFFMVDTQAKTDQYVNAFERQTVRLPAASGAPGTGTPKVVATIPADGATDVDPGLAEITVTFDQDMGEGCSWTGGGPEYPPSPQGASVQWRGKRTCALPVKLESGHHYRVGINSRSYRNFQSVSGQPAEISSISFTTK